MQQDDDVKYDDPKPNPSSPEPDFFELKQVQLAKEGWEYRGMCTLKSVDEAFEDRVNQILFVRVPGKKHEFYYFNRVEE